MVDYVDFVDRCYAYLTPDSSRQDLRDAVKNAVHLYWFRNVHLNVFKFPCMTLNRNELMVSITLVKNTECMLVDNDVYARLITSLMINEEGVGTWRTSIAHGDMRTRVCLFYGTLVTVEDKPRVLIPQCFVNTEKSM